MDDVEVAVEGYVGCHCRVEGTAMIEAELAANLVRHIEDSRANGLPELHFRLWNRADAQAKDEYV